VYALLSVLGCFILGYLEDCRRFLFVLGKWLVERMFLKECMDYMGGLV